MPAKTRREVIINGLMSGKSLSCGCYRKERMSEVRLNSGKDYVGQVFGKLTILYEVERNKRGKRQIMARCSCDGNIDKYNLGSLTSGNTNSCGCYNIEKIKETHRFQVKDYQEKYPLFCKVEEIRDCKNESGVEVRCKNSSCRKWFHPTREQLLNRVSVIEKPGRFPLGAEYNFYCSDECKYSCILYGLRSDPYEIKEVNLNQPTSYELAIWREENLRLQRDEFGYNFCTINEDHDNTDLIAHHIDPKKLEPGLALDLENCIIVCRECHDELHKGECSTGALAGIKCNIKENRQ